MRVYALRDVHLQHSTKPVKILFLDQSGKIGGAERSLVDVVTPLRDRCLVGLFEDGPFRHLLEQHQIPNHVLQGRSLSIQRGSHFTQSISSLGQIAQTVREVVHLSRDYDLIYANTAKAFVIGACASLVSRRPLVYHLRDILSQEHFSRINCALVTKLANRLTRLVITNSKATQEAFVAAGGHKNLTAVVYNGFQPDLYQFSADRIQKLRADLELDQQFVVGHFSRLSPWKGQHILLEALSHCPPEVTALLVGDALFGEQDYVAQLHQQVEDLGLQQRVKFLGFRSDVPELMAACNLVAHTSTAPEPFGRVIVEAMLCGKPVIASAAGGAVELIEPGQTGWLVPPADVDALAAAINGCRQQGEQTAAIASQGQASASQRFHLDTVNQQIDRLLHQVWQNA